MVAEKFTLAAAPERRPRQWETLIEIYRKGKIAEALRGGWRGEKSAKSRAICQGKGRNLTAW